MTKLDKDLEAADVAYAGDAYQIQAAYTRNLSWLSQEQAATNRDNQLALAAAKRVKARREAIEAWRIGQLAGRPAGSVSPYLLLPLRSEAQAQADIDRDKARRPKLALIIGGLA